MIFASCAKDDNGEDINNDPNGAQNNTEQNNNGNSAQSSQEMLKIGFEGGWKSGPLIPNDGKNYEFVDSALALKMQSRYDLNASTIPVSLYYGMTDFDTSEIDMENVTVSVGLWQGEEKLCVLREQSATQLLAEDKLMHLEYPGDGKVEFKFNKDTQGYLPTDILKSFKDKPNSIENRSLKLKLEFSEYDFETEHTIGHIDVYSDPVEIYFSFVGEEIFFSDDYNKLVARTGYDSSDFFGSALRMAFTANKRTVRSQDSVPIAISFGFPEQCSKWSLAHDHRLNTAEYIIAGVYGDGGDVYFERRFSIDEFIELGYKFNDESNVFEKEELIYLPTERLLQTKIITFKIAAYDINGEMILNKADVETLSVKFDDKYMIFGDDN